MAEVNGINVVKPKKENLVWFSFWDNRLGFFEYEISASQGGCKQITIPLPPECESVDEWPKVGSSVEWGHTVKGEVKSLSDGFAWIKMDNKDYTTVYVSSLRKPKTPEQELNDELYELCLNHCDSKFQASEIARKLMNEYTLTKKPQ